MAEPAELLQRLLELFLEPGELDLRDRALREQLADEGQLHEHGRQLLLRPVVQIAFDRTPLDVAGRRDARARVSELSQRVGPRQFEFRVLVCQQRHGGRGVHELWVFGELRVVDDRDGRLAVAFDGGQHPAPGRFGRNAVVVGPVVRVRAPEHEPQARVAERPAQHRLDLAQVRATERCLDDASQYSRGEQFGGEEGQQEAVPESGPCDHV